MAYTEENPGSALESKRAKHHSWRLGAYLTPFVYAAVLLKWPNLLASWLVIAFGAFVMALFVFAGVLHIQDVGGWRRVDDLVKKHPWPSMGAIVIVCGAVLAANMYFNCSMHHHVAKSRNQDTANGSDGAPSSAPSAEKPPQAPFPNTNPHPPIGYSPTSSTPTSPMQSPMPREQAERDMKLINLAIQKYHESHPGPESLAVQENGINQELKEMGTKISIRLHGGRPPTSSNGVQFKDFHADNNQVGIDIRGRADGITFEDSSADHNGTGVLVEPNPIVNRVAPQQVARTGSNSPITQQQTSGNGVSVGGSVGTLNLGVPPAPEKKRTIDVAAIADTARLYPGVAVRVESSPGSIVGSDLIHSLKLSLPQVYGEGDLIVDPQRFAFEGIKIVCSPSPLAPDDHAGLLADSLVVELRHENFMANRTSPPPAAPANFIRIIVGDR